MRAIGARFTSAVRQDIPAMNVPCTDRRDPPLHRKNDTEPRNVHRHYCGYRECGR